MNKVTNSKAVSQEIFNEWAETICDEFFRTIYSGSVTPTTMKHKVATEILRYVKSCTNCALTVKNYVISYYAKKRRVTMYNIKTQKFTTAQCMDKDTFYFCTAIAICWARMQGWEIPKVANMKFLREMKHGEKFRNGEGRLCTFLSPIPKNKNDDVQYYAVLMYNDRLYRERDYNYPCEMIE